MKKNFTENSAEDKAMEVFAEVLIKHLETVEVGDWQKPWVFGNKNGKIMWPRNIDGRDYANSNALLLMLHTQQKGYAAPVYATFDRFSKLNYTDGDKPQRIKDAEGNPLPFVKVNKGAEHTPVIMTVFFPVHKETRQKISYQEFMNLTEEEKKQYNLFPRNFVYRVFNIDQTNLQEARPELYKKLVGEVKSASEEHKNDSEELRVPAIDVMVTKNLWQCPITVQYSNSAYYMRGRDMVVMPEKKQFKYAEGFYGTLLHECAHSTGAKHRYDRDMGGNDSKKYAREELLAELTAALVSSRYGLIKHIKSDSLPYLKNWLNNLKEEPKFLKELLVDVRRASSQIIRRLDVIQQRIDELTHMGVEEPEQYPDFLEINPVTLQPLCDPLRYVVKEETVEA